MPRPANLKNVCKSERQARYRARLKTSGEPEADRVDTALAAAVAALADAVEHGAVQTSEKIILRVLLQGAIRILRQDGFVEERSICVLRRRISRSLRPEIEKYADVSGIRKHFSE